MAVTRQQALFLVFFILIQWLFAGWLIIEATVVGTHIVYPLSTEGYETRTFSWITYHGTFWSPIFLVVYCVVFFAPILPRFVSFKRSALAFVAGMTTWTVIFGLDLVIFVVPAIR